jgi:hypothetical protein
VNILGVPLGKTLNTPIPQCSANEAGMDAKTLCRISPPDMLKNGIRSGAVSVPDAGKQAPWAAQARYVAYVTRDDKLTGFTVHTTKADDFAEITRFLSDRFGASRHPSPPGAQTASTYWNTKHGMVELSCPAGKGCNIGVVFTDWNERTQRGLELRNSVEAPSPATSMRR